MSIWRTPSWNSDNELSSKHFRFLWDANRAAQGVNTNTARGALRNAEEAWQVYVKVMGYREPAESTNPSMRDGNKYKVNFLCIYDGYYMDSTWRGFAFFNIEPSGLQVDPPTWIIPHELMHVFQYHNNNGNYSGQWETHANYARERWLQHYQAFYPNRSNIEALGVRDGHFMISSGRNYYLTWPFLYFVDDNPDNLPDLSDGMIKRLWQEGQPGRILGGDPRPPHADHLAQGHFRLLRPALRDLGFLQPGGDDGRTQPPGSHPQCPPLFHRSHPAPGRARLVARAAEQSPGPGCLCDARTHPRPAAARAAWSR